MIRLHSIRHHAAPRYLKPWALMLYHICRNHPDNTSTDLGVADTPQVHDLADETLIGPYRFRLLQSA